VPKLLTDDHKTKRTGFALMFLTRYAHEGDEFLDSSVTGDETWGFFTTLLNPSNSQEVMTWFKAQAADFNDSAIQKLVSILNKCLENSGD
jgi:hypothetical protein